MSQYYNMSSFISQSFPSLGLNNPMGMICKGAKSSPGSIIESYECFHVAKASSSIWAFSFALIPWEKPFLLFFALLPSLRLHDTDAWNSDHTLMNCNKVDYDKMWT